MKSDAGAYRFGFNGQEQDNEVKGDGNSLEFKFRIYDSRLGKFLSRDPLASQYSYNSPYAFAENDVIRAIDLEGLEKYIIHTRTFAPFKRFGPFFLATGDDRDFSMSTDKSTTSRLSMITTFDIEKQKWQTNYLGSISTFNVGKYQIYSSTSEPNQKGTKISFGNSEKLHLSGNDDALIPFFDDIMPEKISNLQSPDIDLHNQITISANKDKTMLNVKGVLRGNAFPNHESFIEDPSGNRLCLAQFQTAQDPEIGPVLYLFGPEYKLASYEVNINIDEKGNFISAQAKNYDTGQFENVDIQFNTKNSNAK